MAITIPQPLRPAAAAAVLIGFVLSPSISAAGDLPDTLRIATGSVGGTFLPVGHDLASWWESTIPGLVVIADTTAGSVDNLDRLASGRADLAVVGSSPFRGVLASAAALSNQAKTVCTLGTLYVDAEQFVVRSEFIQAGTLLDLTGLIMYPGPHQSGAEVDTRRILSLLGVDVQYVYGEEQAKGYSAAAEALSEGEFDAATFSGGVPIEAVSNLFRRYPGEFRILSFSRHMLNKLRHFDFDYEAVVIRRGIYPGMTEDVHTVGGPNLLVAAPHVDPRILAVLDRSIREGIQVSGKGLRTRQVHPVLQVLDLDLWNQRPVGGGCFDSGVAELDGREARVPSPR